MLLQRVNLGMEERFVILPARVSAVIGCVKCIRGQVLDVLESVIQDGRMSTLIVRMVG